MLLLSAIEEAPAPSTTGEAPAPSMTEEAPAPSSLAGCSDILLNLSGCLTYVEEGSNLTKPEKDCCPALAGLVDSHPVCLCVLLEPNATQSYGISIDSKKALKLPSVCGVQTPPATACSGTFHSLLLAKIILFPYF